MLTSADAVLATKHKEGNTMIRITTALGTIDIELFNKQAPISADNFKRYVEDGHFDGLIFHRVIPGFMVQGGGMEPDMKERNTRSPIENEADNGLKNEVGTLSMARTNDPHSATSQFFINVNDNAFLDFKAKNPQGWGYAVFGKVTEGMDVVMEIVAQPTGNKRHHQDVPLQDIVIEKAEVITE
ncbi:MAG: peptidylprolyl isomerase [Arenicellales bacterium WSBS_2016_MAG_OTU3]